MPHVIAKQQSSRQAVSAGKILGAVLLIVGTSIGGGMLALPVMTAHSGYLPSSVFLLGTWMMMTIGAFLLLEVNLWLPPGSNLISMVRTTLGRRAQWLAWLVYMLLLYCLLCAYIAGGEDLVRGLFHLSGMVLSGWMALLLFVLVFGGVVCLGIRFVDVTNRLIMLAKVMAFLFIVLVTLPLVKAAGLYGGHFASLWHTMTAMITSFGFAIIIPSLRQYLNDNHRALRIALSIGCIVPLVCYLLWEAIIFGVMPKTGTHGLMALTQAKEPISALMTALSALTQRNAVIIAAKTFTSICVVTAFLGVSLSLTDFLADGFKVKKQGAHAWLIYALTFLPPTLLVLFVPQLFVFGISFAGVFCIILLIMLPVWMAHHGIMHQQRTINIAGLSCRHVLRALMVLSCVLLVWGVLLNVRGFLALL